MTPVAGGGERSGPRRVLHVLSGMNRGGIETWLMNVMRRLDPDKVRFDFLVEARDQAEYDQEIEDRGGTIYRGPRFRQRAQASLSLARLLDRQGGYDVVHAHGRHDMAWPISVARLAGVPVRIAHVHNVKDSHHQDPIRRTYKRLMKNVLTNQASWILGCSIAAVESLYGHGAVAENPKMEMLPYGIDMDAFAPRDTRLAVRRALDLPEHALIAGHVGRMVEEKNHPLLLDILEELVRQDGRWHLVLVGDGPLRPRLERAIDARQLRHRVCLTGVRPDVPDLVSAFDAFVFPSRMEGFGLAVIEAQALGVPCVIADHLPSELDVSGAPMARVPLDAGAPAWAEAIIAAHDDAFGDDPAHMAERRRAHADAAHQAVAASPFNIDRCVARLLSRYYDFKDADA